MSIPYIGITDFMNFNQVSHMQGVFKENLAEGQKRRLHVGVMMSFKTLNGMSSKWSDAFPKNETISSIFSSDETMNCLHYADYENIDVRNSLSKAISFGGVGINALQLDMVWPDPFDIAGGIKDSGKKLEVVLQVGKNAIEKLDNNPKEVVKKLLDYEGIVHHVLLDKSMGRGIHLDALALLPFIHEIKDSFPDLGIVVAGGLGPTSLELLAPILKEYKDISIDAQGQLRPSGSALEPINWSMALLYLINALKTFR